MREGRRRRRARLRNKANPSCQRNKPGVVPNFVERRRSERLRVEEWVVHLKRTLQRGKPPVDVAERDPDPSNCGLTAVPGGRLLEPAQRRLSQLCLARKRVSQSQQAKRSSGVR